MPHYKDQDNNLYFLDRDDDSYILPPGSVEITEEEAEAIRAESEIVPDPVVVIKQQILEKSEDALKSGFLHVAMWDLMERYLLDVLDRPAFLALPGVNLMSTEQKRALADSILSSAGPYYNDAYARTKGKYLELKALMDQLP